MGEQEMLSVTEAAARIGVSRSSIKSATQNNRLPSIKRHGLILIKASDLEAYKARTQPEGVKRVGRPRKQRPSQDEGQTPQ